MQGFTSFDKYIKEQRFLNKEALDREFASVSFLLLAASVSLLLLAWLGACLQPDSGRDTRTEQ